MGRFAAVLLFAAMAAGVAAAVVVGVAALPARADFTEGLRALDAGDYETAFREWQALAEAGDPEAQRALAHLYLSGQGVRADPKAALTWYRRAAAQGDAVAQMNLGDLYAGGQGIRRDPVQAYLWLGLAAAQGRRWAARRRDEIAAVMTAAQIARAEKLMHAWPRRGPGDSRHFRARAAHAPKGALRTGPDMLRPHPPRSTQPPAT